MRYRQYLVRLGKDPDAGQVRFYATVEVAA